MMLVKLWELPTSLTIDENVSTKPIEGFVYRFPSEFDNTGNT